MPAKASRGHRFALRIRAALNCARLGDLGTSRSEQARTSAPQSGHTAGSGSRTSTANCVRHPMHAPATVCRRSGKTAGRCAPSNRNRVTSPPHNETMGYRPAVEAIQQRPCTARDRPALQAETGAGAGAIEGALRTRGGTSLPHEEYHAETRVPPIPRLYRRPDRPTRCSRGTTRNPRQSRSTTSCGPSRGAPARLPLARARSARCRISTVKALGRRATARPRVRRGSDHPCHRFAHPGYQTGDRDRVSSRY